MRKTVFLILAVSLILTHEPAWAFLNLFSIGTEDEVAIGRKIARSVERKMPIYRDLDYEKRLIRV